MLRLYPRGNNGRLRVKLSCNYIHEITDGIVEGINDRIDADYLGDFNVLKNLHNLRRKQLCDLVTKSHACISESLVSGDRKICDTKPLANLVNSNVCVSLIITNNPVCECCGNQVESTVIHHWNEPPDYRRVTANVCASCNVKLVPSKLWPRKWTDVGRGWMDHVLPSFDLQKLAVISGHKSVIYLSKLRDAYIFPLSPPNCLSWRNEGVNI